MFALNFEVNFSWCGPAFPDELLRDQLAQKEEESLFSGGAVSGREGETGRRRRQVNG